MSNHTHSTSHAAGHHDDHGASHGSMRDYVIGFVLSVILTAIPFWLVGTHAIADKSTAALVIVAFAAVQIVVHMIYFLHMNTKSEGGWTMLALIFTVIILTIALAGSLWVMYHMNVNMMPTPASMDMG